MTKSLDAEDAEADAGRARDAAVAAEANKNATAARSSALEAAAAAAQGTADAAETRAAANDAKSAAAQAADAATAARSAATRASDAAVAARTDATTANGAAERARSAAAAAQADANTTHRQAAVAHAAAADAIMASEQAAANVKAADELAHKAASSAVQAHMDSIAARTEADHAALDSATTTGHAFAATQAAAAARDAAKAAIDPANDAIRLGTPYRTSDASAGLAVLVGQAAKTLAQQQDATAQARAAEAAKAAQAAKDAAAKADADAKAAAVATANAAADAAAAAQSVALARASSAAAAASAAAAQQADAATSQLDLQANTDALYANVAARDAATDAAAARAAADDAEKDAAAARNAATQAENDAASAHTVANQAEQDAVAAENAAANARADAQQANDAATRAEAQDRADEQARRAALMTGSGASDPGPDLTAEDEQILLAQCGQSCVDEFRSARATAAKDILDWVVANGGQLLLDVIGATDAKRCFGEGDIEGCLWTLVNVASLVAVVGKLPAVTKVVVRIASGVTKFFEESAAATRVLDRLRKLIEKARKDPVKIPCVTSGIAAHSAVHGPVSARAAGLPIPCLKDGITAGKNFKAHFLDHKSLLERVLNKRYEKWKLDEGTEFLSDLHDMAKSGRLVYQGLGGSGHCDDGMNQHVADLQDVFSSLRGVLVADVRIPGFLEHDESPPRFVPLANSLYVQFDGGFLRLDSVRHEGQLTMRIVPAFEMPEVLDGEDEEFVVSSVGDLFFDTSGPALPITRVRYATTSRSEPLIGSVRCVEFQLGGAQCLFADPGWHFGIRPASAGAYDRWRADNRDDASVREHVWSP